MSDANQSTDPIANAKELQLQIAALPRETLSDQFALARLMLPKCSGAMDDLQDYIEGLQTGNAAELRRREQLVFDLLYALRPLFEPDRKPFGRESEMRQWLKGKAPRLHEVFNRATAFLNIDWIETSTADDDAQAS